MTGDKEAVRLNSRRRDRSLPLGRVALVLVLVGAASGGGAGCRREAPRPVGQPVVWNWPVERPLDLCLEQRMPKAGGGTDTEANLRIEGHLAGLGVFPSDRADEFRTVIPCSDEPARYIDVIDGGGETWRIAYRLSGGAVPQVRATPGAKVQFDFDAAFRNGKLARFALSDQVGPLLAIAQGAYTPDAHLDLPFSISWGSSFDERKDSDCPPEVLRALAVRGDKEVAVAPGQIATVERQGRRYRFWNAQSIAVRRPSCVDQEDVVSWALWRE